MKKMSKIAVAAATVAFMFVAAAGTLSAAPPAPNWMPSSPIMAGTQVILLWLPVPNAVKYNVYVNGKKVGDSTSVQYMLPAPEAAGEYSIVLTAVDASGAEGAKSPAGVIRIITIEPPASLYARFADNKVHVRWDQSKGAMIYNVFRSEKEGGEYKLVTSVQGDAYTDTAVQPGKTYYYAVTAKDLAGKESPKSKPYRLAVPLKQEEEKAVKVEIKVVPTRKVTESLFLGSKKLQMFGDMKLGPDGFVYVVDAGQKQVLKLDADSLDVVSVFPSTPEEKEKLRRPTSISFSSDGTIYLVDGFARKVFLFDTTGKMRSDFSVPEPTDPEVLKHVLPHLRAQGPAPGGLYVDEKGGAIYMSDGRYNTLYQFDLKGNFIGTLGHGGNPEEYLAGPGEIFADKNGTDLYVTESLSHVVLVIDKKTAKIKRRIGRKASGFIGGFIGIRGINYDPAGNLVISDSGVHSVQVFDGSTGDYLYHFGDESGTVDPTMKERAQLGIEMPNSAFVKGNRLFIFRGDKMNVVSREIVKK